MRTNKAIHGKERTHVAEALLKVREMIKAGKIDEILKYKKFSHGRYIVTVNTQTKRITTLTHSINGNLCYIHCR